MMKWRDFSLKSLALGVCQAGWFANVVKMNIILREPGDVEKRVEILVNSEQP